MLCFPGVPLQKAIKQDPIRTLTDKTLSCSAVVETNTSLSTVKTPVSRQSRLSQPGGLQLSKRFLLRVVSMARKGVSTVAIFAIIATLSTVACRQQHYCLAAVYFLCLWKIIKLILMSKLSINSLHDTGIINILDCISCVDDRQIYFSNSNLGRGPVPHSEKKLLVYGL